MKTFIHICIHAYIFTFIFVYLYIHLYIKCTYTYICIYHRAESISGYSVVVGLEERNKISEKNGTIHMLKGLMTGMYADFMDINVYNFNIQYGYIHIFMYTHICKHMFLFVCNYTHMNSYLQFLERLIYTYMAT